MPGLLLLLSSRLFRKSLVLLFAECSSLDVVVHGGLTMEAEVVGLFPAPPSPASACTGVSGER